MSIAKKAGNKNIYYYNGGDNKILKENNLMGLS